MMSLKEAAERVRAFADHRALDNIRTDCDAPWREAMKVCANACVQTEVAPITRCWRCREPFDANRPFCPESPISAPCMPAHNTITRERLHEIERHFYDRRERGTRVAYDPAEEYFMVRELTDFAFAKIYEEAKTTPSPLAT